MTQKDLIRQEIERRIGSVNEKQDANPAMPKYRWYMYEGMKEAFIDMKDFLDTLSEEPVDGLEDEIDRVIADYSFTKTIDSGGFKTTVLDYEKIARHFAEWMRRKMMKDAVEGEVVQDLKGRFHVKTNAVSDILYHFGDRVKVLILPEKCQNS